MGGLVVLIVLGNRAVLNIGFLYRNKERSFFCKGSRKL